jgi:hypothetical protein
MSESTQNNVRGARVVYGIKHVKFNTHGTNGKSHRAGAAKKHARGLKNRQIRGDLNASRARESWTTNASLYHAQLEALSKGLAG